MANGDFTVNNGLIGEAGPGALVDGITRPVRVNRFGEQVAIAMLGAKAHQLVNEAAYYTAVNATAGTAIIDTAALTGFVTTTPTMTVFNNNSTVGGIAGKSLYLDFLRLNVVAAGASGTNWAWAMYLDTGNRFTSGGTTITAVNSNMLSSATSNAVINFGAITAPASNAQRKIIAQPGRTTIKVAGDEYLFKFGDTAPVSTGMPMEGTLQLNRVFQCPPIVVPPQCTFLFYEWGAAQATAASFELGLAYWER